jgi:hypothetical protein
MKKDKYGDMNDLAAFVFLINIMGDGQSKNDGDTGQSFPRSDAEDLSCGLAFIPGEVTMARRRGERVEFNQPCDNKCCWYWKFENGSKTYYWERGDYERFGKDKCALCGNEHTTGGHVEPA